MTRTIYGNATVLTGPELNIVENAHIAVVDGFIEEIGVGSVAEAVDLRGAIVFPSFIDAHTHIADSGMKDAVIGLPTVEAVSPPDGLKYRYLQQMSLAELERVLTQAIGELLANGISAFADFREGGAAGVEALRRVVSQYPIRAVILGDSVLSPWDDGYLAEIEDVASHADGIGIGDIARYSVTQLDEIRSVLARTSSLLAVHSAETREAQEACQSSWGCSEVARILEYGPDLLVHLTNPSDGDLEAIRQAGVPVVCCARTNAIIADGLPPIADLIAHGIPLALGTDNMMLSSPDMFREMDWFSRLARGQSRRADIVSSREVLSIATLGGACALGLESDLGALEVGKAASFVALNLKSRNLCGVKDLYSAIVHRAGPQDIVSVVSRGICVHSGREE